MTARDPPARLRGGVWGLSKLVLLVGKNKVCCLQLELGLLEHPKLRLGLESGQGLKVSFWLWAVELHK